jgi:hypothetical protein
MRYDVWELRPGNLIGTLLTEAAVLDEVRGLEVRGLLDAGWAPDDLSVGQIDGTIGTLVADGDALATLAYGDGMRRASRSA